MIRSKVNTVIPHLTRHIVALVCVSLLATLSVRAEVPGTGKLSGMVTASQAFTAAQVYIRNVDLGIVYRFATCNLFHFFLPMLFLRIVSLRNSYSTALFYVRGKVYQPQ